MANETVCALLVRSGGMIPHMRNASVIQPCYRVATSQHRQRAVTVWYYCLPFEFKLPSDTIDCCWAQPVLISQSATSLVDVNCILIMFPYLLTALHFPSF
jgi:hypothetical protein